MGSRDDMYLVPVVAAIAALIYLPLCVLTAPVWLPYQFVRRIVCRHAETLVRNKYTHCKRCGKRLSQTPVYDESHG